MPRPFRVLVMYAEGWEKAANYRTLVIRHIGSQE